MTLKSLPISRIFWKLPYLNIFFFFLCFMFPLQPVVLILVCVTFHCSFQSWFSETSETGTGLHLPVLALVLQVSHALFHNDELLSRVLQEAGRTPTRLQSHSEYLKSASQDTCKAGGAFELYMYLTCFKQYHEKKAWKEMLLLLQWKCRVTRTWVRNASSSDRHSFWNACHHNCHSLGIGYLTMLPVDRHAALGLNPFLTLLWSVHDTHGPGKLQFILCVPGTTQPWGLRHHFISL